jgi:hypothetical protein
MLQQHFQTVLKMNMAKKEDIKSHETTALKMFFSAFPMFLDPKKLASI